MHKDLKKISVTEEQISSWIDRISKEINKDYEGKSPMFIGLLKGAIPFMTDLLKKITVDAEVNYMKVSSYSGTQSTGFISIKGEVPNVKDRDVILIDDILDTGRTLDSVREVLLDHGAKSVNICVLLDKPEGRKVDIMPRYVGGLVPNEFVVGYGLDYNEHYRNLPYIGVLKEEIYTK